METGQFVKVYITHYFIGEEILEARERLYFPEPTTVAVFGGFLIGKILGKPLACRIDLVKKLIYNVDVFVHWKRKW